MSGELAPQTEAFIHVALAEGRFASREQLLDAAVAALRNEKIPMVPEEHMAAVEEGIREANEGKLVPADVEDAVRRMYARNAARKGA
ncbi:MAG: hypothetical protein JNK76_17205 [Planctomycetales bacterium]|nr:hypothetical protein [Planctomycetales bacterium]MBN8627577.1 hypothetical protein [Planctomycetota bacterium]